MSLPLPASPTARRRTRTAAALAVAALTVAAMAATPGAARAASGVRDGRTSATALASCYDVQQVTPSAPSGVYWLYTPALGYPQQFSCDMTTDGGGWVLVGRGRDNWSFLPEGQGSTADVASTVTGPAAFAPKALSTATVNGLLAGTAVKDLPDGVRLRRATNQAGTAWQEVRVHPADMGPWRWAFGGGYPLASISYDGIAGTASTFASSCSGGTRCLDTQRKVYNGYQPGFGLGPGVSAGPVSATSYLWGKTGQAGYAEPFTQVWLRPTVRWDSLAFTSAAAGLPASTNRLLFDNFAAGQPAGVSGQANGMSTERDTEVRAMAQLGGTMFVGGNFSQVDLYTSPASSVPQSYLAAFSVGDGGWVPTFRPTFNGKVNAVAALPNGLLAVGGEFSAVNGTPTSGLVVLDPATGALAPGWNATLQYRSATTSPGTVTSLGVQGGWLYVAGDFTHVSGGSPAGGYVYAKYGARVSVANGTPDAHWNPAFDGTPIFVYPSSQGDRAYFGGFFGTMNDKANAALRFAVVSTSAGATPVPGLQTWVTSSPSKIQYQQTAVEDGSTFVLGGAEHAFFFYDRATMALDRGNITKGDNIAGGDFQASVVDHGVAYGSCHCSLSYVYGGARSYEQTTGYDRIDNLRFVGGFDTATGVDVNTFTPWIRTRATRGPWSLVVDSAECLWAGGDLTQTRRLSDGAWQSSGGFGRFCRNDHTAPPVPTGVRTTTAADGTVTVAWTGGSDDRPSATRYAVYAGDRVLATTTSWKVAGLPIPAGTRVQVRSFDVAGNWSATSTAVTSS